MSKWMTGYVCLSMILCGASRTQASPEKMEFETASVKPAPPPTGGGIFTSMSGGPGSSDPARFVCDNCSLSVLVTAAYDLRPNELIAPAWMGSARFDVTAKIAPGATRDQFREMLQNLLVERFKLAYRRETKEMDAFDLVVGKGGFKLHESVDEAPGASRENVPARRMGEMSGAAPGGAAGGIVPTNNSGGATRSGTSTMRGKMTTERLCVSLARQVQRPVIDATGLTGKYDFDLTWVPGPTSAAATEDNPGPTLANVLQEIGLKLEPKKRQIAVLVVESAEKTPVEN